MSLNSDLRAYLISRVHQLCSEIEKAHLELARVNTLLVLEFKTSNVLTEPLKPPTIELPPVPFAEDRPEVEGPQGPVRQTRLVPSATPLRSRPRLATYNSSPDLKPWPGSSANKVHPAHRPSVTGQSRFPDFSTVS